VEKLFFPRRAQEIKKGKKFLDFDTCKGIGMRG